MAYKLTADLAESDKVWTPGNGSQLVAVCDVQAARSEYRGEEAFYVTTVGVFTGETHRFRSTSQTRWFVHTEP